MDKFYLTTAIDYVNGAPHIGHAYEKILTDIIARHFSQRTNNLFFLTGTDEHGIKIQKTSAAQGKTPKQLCDENAQKFKDAWKALDINYNRFIRTTDEDHEKIVQKIFKKLVEKGDIYKHEYEGLYCSGCECFLNSKDLTEDGLCPDHLKKPEVVKEENYFFKLSSYKDAIIEHIKSHPDFIVPSFRANEVLNQLEDIQDISVSRNKANVGWGIDVLDDSYQFDGDTGDNIKDNLRSPKFIFNLLQKFDGEKKCVLCDCKIESIIQAAHIYPVADIRKRHDLDFSTKFKLAIDGDNGIWLCENHHKLFDSGLIWFEEGKLCVSHKLDVDDIIFVKQVTTIDKIAPKYINERMLAYFDSRAGLPPRVVLP